jgi:trigger factor
VNVSFEKKDELNAIISVVITNDDYKENVDKQFKDYRKKAKIPGFRPGTVPMGMVKQMVGKSVLFEEVNRLTSEHLYEYLKENNIDILGQPMTSVEKESVTDFENYGDFTFHFDLGLAPHFDLKISNKETLTRYTIEVDDKEVQTEVTNLARQNGKLEDKDKSETENDSLVMRVTELAENGEPKEDGVLDQEVTVLPEVVKSDKLKKQLVGVSVGDSLTLDIFELFNDNDMVIVQSLGIKKEDVPAISKTFKAEIKQIRSVVPAELNQEFFDMVMGPGACTSKEEFEQKIKENLGSYYVGEAEQQLEAEINAMLENSHKLTLPDSFLKRWLQETKPETYNADNVDELYTKESVVLRKQLVREKIADEQNVEVTNDDINQASFAYTAQMLRQYGLNNPDPAMVQNFEAKNREDKNYLMRIRDVVVEKKVLNAVKEVITIKSKNVSVDKFYDTVKDFNDKG